MKGQFHRDASSRKIYEDFDHHGDRYVEIADAIVKHFGLTRTEQPVTNTVDVIFCGYALRDELVQLAWDNWSGLIVTTMNPEAELLVEQIGQFMEQNKDPSNQSAQVTARKLVEPEL